jgi:SAM-dependent methyltransferase
MREYERWLGRPGVSGALMRWAMGPLGVYFVNSPLFRLPENLQLDPSLRVLEVGCGRGSLLRMLQERVRFDQRPAGIDYSVRALRLAQRDEARAGRPLRLARATATDLPFGGGSFDLVLCGHMVKHLSDEELIDFLRETKRVLAVGGLALIWDFAPSGNVLLDRWNRRLLSTGVAGLKLRSSQALLQTSELAGFDFVRDANLRPFLLPPMPRASVLLGLPPEAPSPDAEPPEARTGAG